MSLKLKTVSKIFNVLFLDSCQAYRVVCPTTKFLPYDSDMFVPKHTHSPKSEELDEARVGVLGGQTLELKRYKKWTLGM